MTRVENAKELIEAYAEAAEHDLEVMLQELIPGDDTCGVNFNSYRKNGESCVEFTAQKIRLSPPSFGVPRVVVSREIPEIIEPGRKILDALGFDGYSCTEFKKDKRDGIYKLMEVNGRLNLSVLHSTRCGINFPWIIYEDLLHNRLPKTREQENGVYWIDMIKDVITSLRFFLKERYSLRQYLRPYISAHIFANFDLRDLRPFFKRCLDILKMGFAAVFSPLRRSFFWRKQ